MVLDDEELVKETIQESISVKQKLADQQTNTLLEISKIISKSLKQNGTIYLFGNGGSAADAQHVAAELVGRFARERKALPAEALTTNTSILTAIGNDYDFSDIFSRQVSAKVGPNDIVVGISTSGKSKNVLNGLKEAKSVGAKTIGFTGQDPNEMKQLTDICLCIPSKSTPRILWNRSGGWCIGLRGPRVLPRI